MFYIGDEVIDRLIKEDVPYIDLTTVVLEIGNEKGKITFTAREMTILSGIEEVLRIFGKFNIKAIRYLPSGSRVQSGQTFLEAEGKASDLHMAWKVSLNILEYSCGIATKTKMLLEKAQKINPSISLVTTRKNFPGTKELVIKAIMNGGAYPHRLGLSETILIFKQHINFIGGFNILADRMKNIKRRALEKKVIVEVETIEEAVLMATAGADGLQFDKMPPSCLKEVVDKIRSIHPEITLIAAGGVNDSNIEEYTNTGVDILNTSCVFFGKPSDIKVSIQKISG